MKARIKGIAGYIKKMQLNYSYSQAYNCTPHFGEICSYNITLIQEDLTEIKFSGVQPEEITILE